MKKFHKVLLGSLLTLFLSVGITKAEFTSLTPFYLSDNGTNWITSVSTYELGSSTNRIAKIWTTAIDTTTITIGGGSVVSIGSTIGGATEGSVLFAGVSGVLAQDNSNFFWDDTNNMLGIGTATPTHTLNVVGNSKIEVASGKYVAFGAVDSGNGIGVLLSGNASDVIGISSYNTYLNRGTLTLYSDSFISGYSQTLGDFQFSNNANGNLMYLSATGNLGIGTVTPDASAKLQIDSTTKGFLPPRMKGSEAEAISSPANGLLIFCDDGNGVTITSTGWWGYDGGWVKLN